MDLRGSLHSTDLSTLVRFLASLGTSGRLRVTHGTRRGELYFESGRVTAAAFGESRGLAALDAIAAKMGDGRFTFKRGVPPPKRELDLTPAALRARLDALASPVPARVYPSRTNGAAAAGAAPRPVREEFRQLPRDAPPTAAVVAPVVPAKEPSRSAAELAAR